LYPPVDAGLFGQKESHEMKDAYNHCLRFVERAKQRGMKPTVWLFATVALLQASGLTTLFLSDSPWLRLK